MQNPQTDFVSVTPQMAKEWLKSNTHNRKVSEEIVEAYANDMRMGAWRLTHQGIGFDCTGRLIDGQHRLQAIIKAGFPVLMAVTRGLSLEAQEVVDGQKPRSVADQLNLVDGLPSANKYAGACRVIAEIEKGQQISKYTLHETRTILRGYKEKIGQMLAIMRSTPFDSVLITGSLAYASAADPGKIRQFAIQIRDGEGLKKTDAAYLVRDYIHKHGCRDRRSIIALMLRAAHDYLHAHQVSYYRVADLADPDSKYMARVIEFFQIANRT